MLLVERLFANYVVLTLVCNDVPVNGIKCQKAGVAVRFILLVM